MTQKRLFGISGAIATAALIGGLLAGCMEKDLYDPNYGKEPLPDPSEYFGFETRGDVKLSVNYDVPGLVALLEVYDEAVKRLGFEPQETSPTLSDKPSYQEASELAHRLMEMYVSGEIDRVELIYHHFKSMGVQILLRETYLPIDLTRVVDEEEKQKEEEVQGGEIANDYIIEPSAEELIANLIPTVLSQKFFTAAVDSNASEHAARTLAMQVATDNANELIQDLTKQYNKSRQQAITNELLDIVGGSMQ